MGPLHSFRNQERFASEKAGEKTWADTIIGHRNSECSSRNSFNSQVINSESASQVTHFSAKLHN